MKSEHQALIQSGGYVLLGDRNVIRLTGKDRHRLLHSFCTAEIKQLRDGAITEAFILNDKGKVLWHGLVWSLPDALLLCGHGNFGERIRAHLDQYVIREDVQIEDLSKSCVSFFVAGSDSQRKLMQAVGELLGEYGFELPSQNEAIALKLQNDISDDTLVVANCEIAGWGYFLLVDPSLTETIEKLLNGCGLQACSVETLEWVRIESRIPRYGKDIDESNLPQEVNRDGKAISFNKGCYLGQETVARIDALGHVNQILIGFKINSEAVPAVGTTFVDNGKNIGRMTSIILTPDGIIGLGYIRRQFAVEGTVLEFDGGQGVVSFGQSVI